VPSYLHEVLIEMFRDRPALVADVLGGPMGMEVPGFDKAALSSGDLTDVQPKEYRADAVVTLTVADAVVMAVVVEVQLGVDRRKRWSWPVYLTTVHARLMCPVVLLVVCPDASVADWCAQPIAVGHPGFVLAPSVLGPRQMPAITDVELARRQPELAVLSAIAHGGRADPVPVFEALLAALDVVDRDHASLYTDLVLAALPAAGQALLEELMTTTPHRYQSDFARRYFGQGEAKGKAEGKATAVLMILDTRGIAVPEDRRAEITACTDLERLDRWINRAVTVTTIEDLFGVAE
jgi:hypothetical protein